MASEVHYDVRCRFENRDVARDWVGWLLDEHLDEVREAGATDACVVRLQDPGIVYEARYLFPDLETFRRYEEHHAPRLRAMGLERFPLSLGLAYSRTVAERVSR